MVKNCPLDSEEHLTDIQYTETWPVISSFLKHSAWFMVASMCILLCATNAQLQLSCELSWLLSMFKASFIVDILENVWKNCVVLLKNCFGIAKFYLSTWPELFLNLCFYTWSPTLLSLWHTPCISSVHTFWHSGFAFTEKQFSGISGTPEWM